MDYSALRLTDSPEASWADWHVQNHLTVSEKEQVL
jgi:hypothetical protein